MITDKRHPWRAGLPKEEEIDGVRRRYIPRISFRVSRTIYEQWQIEAEAKGTTVANIAKLRALRP